MYLHSSICFRLRPLFIIEKLMNWELKSCLLLSLSKSHFTAANVQLVSGFPQCNVSLLSTSIPASLLAWSLFHWGRWNGVPPYYWLGHFWKSCSYLCQKSLLCFLITANQLLHHHHLSRCFVSHLVETDTTTTGKVQEYIAPKLLQLFWKRG